MSVIQQPRALDFRTQYGLPLTEQDEEINVDLFAGGGGASTGLEMGLGRPVHIVMTQVRCPAPHEITTSSISCMQKVKADECAQGALGGKE